MAKQYIGESYTDSLGQQWRWDGKTYVRNFGASPMASIKRSWDQKIVPAVEQYAERQTRLNQEAFGKYSLDNIRQSVSGMIEENRSLNDQQRGLGVQLLNWVENLGFFAEDPDTPTSNHVAATMSEGGNADMLEGTTNAAKNVNSTNLEEDIAVEKEPIKEEKVNTKKSKGSLTNEIESDEFEGDNAPGMKDAKTIFLEDTANSPAAKAGLDDDLRWQARQRYEDFLKKRKVETSLGKAK